MPHVFLSYASVDVNLADLVQLKLKEAGVDVWMDHNALRAGEEWRNAIDEGIASANALVVILTPESCKSPYVTYEWSYALGNGIKVVPLFFDDADVHPRLAALQHLDFRDQRKGPWDIFFEEVAENQQEIVCSDQWKDYVSLLGVYVEANDVLDDRPFSVCEFFFTRDGEMQFEGYSYDNDGHEYYKWWSIFLHVDTAQPRMSYIYGTENLGEIGRDEGFGCISLGWDADKKMWNAEHGYFLDMAEAKPRHARMTRFEEVARLFELDVNPASRDDRRKIVRLLLENKTDSVVKDLFRR